MVKNLAANSGSVRDVGSIPGSGRTPGEGKSNPLQDSCLENPMDRGAWWATVHVVTKSGTRLRDYAYMQAWELGFVWKCWATSKFISFFSDTVLKRK